MPADVQLSAWRGARALALAPPGGGNVIIKLAAASRRISSLKRAGARAARSSGGIKLAPLIGAAAPLGWRRGSLKTA